MLYCAVERTFFHERLKMTEIYSQNTNKMRVIINWKFCSQSSTVMLLSEMTSLLPEDDIVTLRSPIHDATFSVVEKLSPASVAFSIFKYAPFV